MSIVSREKIHCRIYLENMLGNKCQSVKLCWPFKMFGLQLSLGCMSPADLENVFFSPQSQSVIEGQDVFFQCVSGDSTPLAHISWFKNSRAITRGTQIQVLHRKPELWSFAGFQFSACPEMKFIPNPLDVTIRF